MFQIKVRKSWGKHFGCSHLTHHLKLMQRARSSESQLHTARGQYLVPKYPLLFASRLYPLNHGIEQSQRACVLFSCIMQSTIFQCEHWCHLRRQNLWFTTFCLSHLGLVRFSVPLHCHTSMPNSKSFSTYCAGLSVLVIYLTNPVVCVLPSVIKITKSFMLFQ